MTKTPCPSEKEAPMSTPKYTANDIRRLSETVGLTIAEDRLDLVRDAANTASAFIGGTSPIPLGETAPATSFDPRWK